MKCWVLSAAVSALPYALLIGFIMNGGAARRARTYLTPVSSLLATASNVIVGKRCTAVAALLGKVGSEVTAALARLVLIIAT